MYSGDQSDTPSQQASSSASYYYDAPYYTFDESQPRLHNHAAHYEESNLTLSDGPFGYSTFNARDWFDNLNVHQQPSSLPPSEGEVLFNLDPQPLDVGPYTSFSMGEFVNPNMGSASTSFGPSSVSAANPNTYYHERRTLDVELMGYTYDPQVHDKPHVLQRLIGAGDLSIPHKPVGYILFARYGIFPYFSDVDLSTELNHSLIGYLRQGETNIDFSNKVWAFLQDWELDKRMDLTALLEGEIKLGGVKVEVMILFPSPVFILKYPQDGDMRVLKLGDAMPKDVFDRLVPVLNLNSSQNNVVDIQTDLSQSWVDGYLRKGPSSTKKGKERQVGKGRVKQNIDSKTKKDLDKIPGTFEIFSNMSAYFQANLLRGNDFHHTFLKGGWQSDTKAEKIRQNDVICEEAWKACAKVAAQPNLPSYDVMFRKVLLDKRSRVGKAFSTFVDQKVSEMVDMMGTSQFLKSFGLGLSTVPEDFEDHEGRVMDTLCALMGAPDVNPRRLPFQEQHFVDFLTDAFYGVAPLSQGDPDPRRLVARFFFSGHISDNVIAFAAATWLYRGIQLLSEKNTDLSGYGDLPNFTIHYIFAVMRGRVQVLAEDEDFAQFKQRIDSLPP